MDQPPVPLSHERLTEPTPVDPAASDALQWHYDPGFSRLGTMVAALVFCLCVGHVGYLVWTADRLDRVALPERALSHMVSRTMDVEEALGRAPEWERTLYEWLSGGDVSEREHAMVWYQELSERTADPLVHLQLAILQAESGGVPKVERRVKQWHRREAPFPLFARLLSAAYLKAPVDPDGVTELQRSWRNSCRRGGSTIASACVWPSVVRIEISSTTLNKPPSRGLHSYLSGRDGFLWWNW